MNFRSDLKQILIGVTFLLIVVLPISSLFLLFAYLSPFLEDFFAVQIGRGLSIGNLRAYLYYISTFSISTLLISGYIFVTLYLSDSEMSMNKRLSFPLVNSFMILIGTRFLKYFSDYGFYANLSGALVDFTILLPILASSKILKMVLEDQSKSSLDLLIDISEKTMDFWNLMSNLKFILIFGSVAYLVELKVLSQFSNLIFRMIGPIFIVLSILAIYTLRDDDFRKIIRTLLKAESS